MQPRISLYLSTRRDKDIINEIKDVDEGDRSWYVRELVRDGIKFRRGVTTQFPTQITEPVFEDYDNSVDAVLEERLDNF